MTTEPLFSFLLPRGLLKSIALFQSDDASRPTLQCTSIEIRASGLRHDLTLAATDGRRLATYQCEIEQDTLFGELPASAKLLADFSGCSRLPKVEGPEGDRVTVEVHPKHVEFVADRIRYTAKRLEEEVHFPEWRAIVPKGEAESLTQFAVNHDLLADFGKAAKWCVKGPPTLALRSFGEGRPIAVLFPEKREFFGLIMPMKFENPETVPQWLREAASVVRKETPDTSEASAVEAAA